MPVKKKTVTRRVSKPKISVASIRKKLNHGTFDWSPKDHLDTGSVELNRVLGNEETGIPYGNIIEISGAPSSGKSALAMDLAAAGQQINDAVVIWDDFENSFQVAEDENDKVWATRRGLVCHKGAENFFCLKPYIGKFGRTKRLSTCNDLFEETEELLGQLVEAYPGRPIINVFDSITAMLVDDEAAAGVSDQNMRTRNSLPMFLSQTMRRYVALYAEYNTLAIYINQLRDNVGVYFGDPKKTTGGNAMLFYAHVRVRMQRAGGGFMTKSGRRIGVKGIIRNYKNKAGGIEGDQCGYKLFFSGRTKFLDAEEVKKRPKD
jgi:recombination protein RecA